MWVPTHAPNPLVIRPGSIPTLLMCHACRLPPGTCPSHGSFLSQWFFNGGAYYRVTTPHAQVRREVDLSLLVLGVWLGNHLSLLVLLFGVPRPEASTLYCAASYCVASSTLVPTWVSGGGTTRMQALLALNPVSARGRSTPESWSTPEAWSTPFLTSLRP